MAGSREPVTNIVQGGKEAARAAMQDDAPYWRWSARPRAFTATSPPQTPPAAGAQPPMRRSRPTCSSAALFRGIVQQASIQAYGRLGQTVLFQRVADQTRRTAFGEPPTDSEIGTRRAMRATRSTCAN